MTDEPLNFETDPTYRVELNIWRGATPLHNLLLDPRCVAVDIAAGKPPRPRLVHLPACSCGDRAAALTRPGVLKQD